MDKWVILGKPECRWCKEAMQLLHERDIEFTYMDITNAPGVTDFMILSGLWTVPQVFCNGDRIGNYDNLSEWFFEQDRWEPRPPIYPGEWNDE
jgi:glutaredoxin